MVTNASRDLIDQDVSLFDALINDHKTLSKILEEMKVALLEKKGGLLAQLNTAFIRHADSEERYFYLRLRRFSGLTELVHSALYEHDAIRDFLQQLGDEEPASIQWLDIFSALEDALLRHVKKEEELIFPRARRTFSPDEMNQIRNQIEEEHRKDPLQHRYREAMAPRAGA